MIRYCLKKYPFTIKSWIAQIVIPFLCRTHLGMGGYINDIRINFSGDADHPKEKRDGIKLQSQQIIYSHRIYLLIFPSKEENVVNLYRNRLG